MRPRVSVIVAAYNASAFIEKSVISALAQTEKNIEVLVVDDGSSDETPECVRKISDPRLRLFVLEENRGQSHARNVAIRAARGEWITFLDADDWYAHNRFEVLLKVAEEYHADIVADDIYRIVDPVDPHPRTKLGKHHLRQPKVIDAADFLQLDSGLKPVIRSEILRQHGILFDERLRYGEDTLLLLECLLANARLVLCPEPLYYYLDRPGSLTTNRVKTLDQRCRTTRELLRRDGIQKDAVLRGLLEKRLVEAEAGLRYYRVVEPLRQWQLREAWRAGLFDPAFVFLLLKSLPKAWNNRVGRRWSAHT